MFVAHDHKFIRFTITIHQSVTFYKIYTALSEYYVRSNQLKCMIWQKWRNNEHDEWWVLPGPLTIMKKRNGRFCTHTTFNITITNIVWHKHMQYRKTQIKQLKYTHATKITQNNELTEITNNTTVQSHKITVTLKTHFSQISPTLTCWSWICCSINAELNLFTSTGDYVHIL